MRINRKYILDIEIDCEHAKTMRGNELDWDSYPNWDINYGGNEGAFIDRLISDLKSHNKYSGISVRAKKIEN